MKQGFYDGVFYLNYRYIAIQTDKRIGNGYTLLLYHMQSNKKSFIDEFLDAYEFIDHPASHTRTADQDISVIRVRNFSI